MSIYRIVVLVFLSTSLLRIAYIIWHYLIKRKQITPTLAKIVWPNDPVMDAFAYRRSQNHDKTLSSPYISYNYNSKIYTSDSSKAKEIIRCAQKKQNNTEYLLIYIDKDKPEDYTYYPQPDYRLSLIYALSVSMILCILYIVLP